VYTKVLHNRQLTRLPPGRFILPTTGVNGRVMLLPHATPTHPNDGTISRVRNRCTYALIPRHQCSSDDLEKDARATIHGRPRFKGSMDIATSVCRRWCSCVQLVALLEAVAAVRYQLHGRLSKRRLSCNCTLSMCSTHLLIGRARRCDRTREGREF
jgi:hypothetical protein